MKITSLGILPLLPGYFKKPFMVCNAALQVTLDTEITFKWIHLCALRAQKADTARNLPLKHANTLTCTKRTVIFHALFCPFLLCCSMEIPNDPYDGAQEYAGRCLTFLQKHLSPLQNHQCCISKASLELESDCRKEIFATLTLTLPI